MEWQPIETAPKDKGLVLLLSQSGTHSIDRGEFAHRMIAAAREDGDECWFTHWMPLPPPPQKETRRSGLRGSNTPEEKQPPETRGSVYDI